MRIRSNVALLLLLSPLILTGADCGEDFPPDLPLADNSMRVTFVGDATFAANPIKGSNIAGMAEVEAEVDNRHVNLRFPVKTTVPYTIDVTTTSGAHIFYCTHPTPTCPQFVADETRGSGTITITQVTPHLRGTFKGKTIFRGQADSTREIKLGEFDTDY